MNNNLKDLRIQNKISELELATALGVSEGTIEKWEAEEENPEGKELHRLCQFFSVAPDYFQNFEIPEFTKIKTKCIEILSDALSSKNSKEVFTPKERASIRGSLRKGIIPRLELLPKFEDIVGREWVCIAICELIDNQKATRYSPEDMDLLVYAQQKAPIWYIESVKARKKFVRSMCRKRVSNIDLAHSEYMLDKLGI